MPRWCRPPAAASICAALWLLWALLPSAGNLTAGESTSTAAAGLDPADSHRSGTSTLWLLSWASPGPSDGAPDRILDLMAGDGQGDPGGRGMTPIHRAPSHVLALGPDASEVSRISPQLEAESLGAWREGREYYLAYASSARPGSPPLDELGRVLYQDAVAAVVEVSRPDAPRLHESYSTERIFPRALSLAPRAVPGQAALDGPLEHNPRIQAMVDEVDIEFLEAEVQWLQDLGGRRSDTQSARRAEDYLAARFHDLGYAQVETFDFNDWSDNVIAIKPGALHPERIVVLGGHYDSISRSGPAPGADDNASGTVGVLEAARILQPYDFESTVYFIGWSGEEQGLVGSAHWAAWAADQGLEIQAYVNLDMLGYVSGGQDLDIISNPASEWLRDLCFEAVPLYVPDLPVVEGFLSGGSSDHASFWAEGYPAVFFFEDSGSYSPYIHTSQDVIGISLNSFEFMRKNVKAAVAVTAVLAVPYQLHIEHTPPAESPRPDEPLALEARILGAAALQPDSLVLRYRCALTGFESIRLAPAGQPHEYRAEIPPLSAGTVLEYYLEAVDTEGHTAAHPEGAPARRLHTLIVGMETVHSDDFEQDRGWTVGRPGDSAVSGIWIRTDPNGTNYQPEDDHTPGSGTLCFVTGNGMPGGPDGEEDVDGGVTSLLSPVYNLRDTAHVTLSYWRWFVNEVARDDALRVWISNNGGQTWLLLEEVAETAAPWRQARFEDLGRLLPVTDTMRLLFQAEDTGLASLTEAALDDLVWSGVPLAPVGLARLPLVSASVGSFPALRCLPNPASGESRVRLRLDRARDISLTVHDVGGRTVRRLLETALPEGIHEVVWDGRDTEGRPLAGGVYWVRLRSGELQREEKLVRIR